MTAGIRTAAQREAERIITEEMHAEAITGALPYRVGFIEGAVWAQARVTPTHTQFLHTLVTHPHLPDKPDGRGVVGGRCACGEKFQGGHNSPNYASHLADKLMELVAGLAEGESK